MKRKQYFVKKFLPSASSPPPTRPVLDTGTFQRYYLRACLAALLLFAFLWYFHFSIIGETTRLREANNHLTILLQMQTELCEAMRLKMENPPAQFAAFLIAVEMRSMKHREWFAVNADDRAVAKFDDFIVALREDVEFLQQNRGEEDELKLAFNKLQAEVKLALLGSGLKNSVQLLRVAARKIDEDEEEKEKVDKAEPKSHEEEEEDSGDDDDKAGGAEQYGQVD